MHLPINFILDLNIGAWHGFYGISDVEGYRKRNGDYFTKKFLGILTKVFNFPLFDL